MSREEIIGAMNGCAAELGHAPSLTEFRRLTKTSLNQIRKNFGNYTRLLQASGVERHGAGYTASLKSLFLDWAQVARSHGKLPTIAEYEVAGKFSVRPLVRRFGTWSQTPTGLLEYARQEGLEGEWEDVLKLIADHAEEEARKRWTFDSLSIMPLRPRIPADQTIYGKPGHAPLNCAPTDENGVIFAFGTVAKDLGFSVLHIQAAFPDCEALRQAGPNRWVRVRIEFEFESRNFLTHMHPDTGCDLIICWRHNWPECPLEVLALENVLEGFGRA